MNGKKPEDSVEPKNLPWVEKYRPQSLDDLISHEEIISTIRRFVDEGRLPHLLLYGPPGTGKTSTILACAKQMYKPSEFSSMVLELNASDDRGIKVVRTRILNFASTRTIFKSGMKLIILDEADAMTNDAQNALRRVIEKFTDNVRFCLICNYLTKIIPALQSRCTRFRFGPLTVKQMKSRLEYVIGQEKLDITPEALDSVMELSGGDMRQSLNLLQSCSMAFPHIDANSVYLCLGQPTPSDMRRIVEAVLNDGFKDACDKVAKIKREKGLALQDMLTQLHSYVHRIDFPCNVRISLLKNLSEIEQRLAGGSGEEIQLPAVVASFFMIRDSVVKCA